MSNIKDDPKDVLEILNSLGFVGITASQLKCFMKELKLYRKIKEREQQQWKEKVKEKLSKKQQYSFNKILQEHVCKINTTKSEYVSSESSLSQTDSLIKIKIKCSSQDKENKVQYNVSQTLDDSISLSDISKGYNNYHKKYMISDNSRCETNLSKDFVSLNLENDNARTFEKITDTIHKKDTENIMENKRSCSARDIPKRRSRSRQRSVGSESVKTLTTRASSVQSKRSRDPSKSKSFIRPWQLQSETLHRKPLVCQKSDPVALYHKYQQEWKQLSLPGEEGHARVRWEVREKMLGSDPNPRPTLWKSASTSTLKRR